MNGENPYEVDLGPGPHNYQALSPVSFLPRAASVFPNHCSLIDGSRQFQWSETYDRCRRLANALCNRGVGVGDTVSVICPNTVAIYEASFAVPMVGAVLNTINTRLDPKTIAFILQHAETKVLITDIELSATVKEALSRLNEKPFVIDSLHDSIVDGETLGEVTYEDFLSEGDPQFAWQPPTDEWQAIALNYTSGTTGNPKGVVTHHRGAYLNALSNAIGWEMQHHPVYLWTLPMFHCNGWCFPWTMAALAGTNVCLRRVEGQAILDAITQHQVTHFCGAPIVLSMILDATGDAGHKFSHPVHVMTAAAPPPASVLQSMAAQGFHVTHVYGLTETYGPATICAWKVPWDSLDAEQQAQKKSRQGVAYHVLQGLAVMDPETMQPVASDGQTLGEVMFRGNIVMKGYLKNPQATQDALRDGWFHSGDLGVMHPDGYIQLKDRSKDIIISGGENISSIEIEDILYRHPAVQEAAVVAKTDIKWGETPCAFIKLKTGVDDVTAHDIIAFCRQNLAAFKIPKTVVFADLPKTSTGKVQKFKLRALAESVDSPK